jgi:two-component system aerobic respiration control sensor histidine kinase ArcB
MVASPKMSDTEQLTVLLIEDDAIVRIVHSSFLEELGCKVEIACHGTEALTKVNNQYDIIFIDIGLPDMLGTDVVKQFRKNSNNQHTPIVALTGYSSESNKKDFLASGINQIAIKPVLYEELKKIVQHWSEFLESRS